METLIAMGDLCRFVISGEYDEDLDRFVDDLCQEEAVEDGFCAEHYDWMWGPGDESTIA